MSTRPPSGRWAEPAMELLATILPVAQRDGFVRDPEAAAEACEQLNDTVCLGWAWENADR